MLDLHRIHLIFKVFLKVQKIAKKEKLVMGRPLIGGVNSLSTNLSTAIVDNKNLRAKKNIA